jgi:hypothetical protein
LRLDTRCQAIHCPVPCRTPTWPLILFVVLGMYWLARSVMQADVFGTLLDACFLALCLILIAVKIMNPRGEAGTPIAIGRRPEWAAPPHNRVMVEVLGITVSYCAARVRRRGRRGGRGNGGTKNCCIAMIPLLAPSDGSRQCSVMPAIEVEADNRRIRSAPPHLTRSGPVGVRPDAWGPCLNRASH